MAGLADIKITRADGADAADVKPGVRREIVIPDSIDKYRDPAPAPAKKGWSLGDFVQNLPSLPSSSPGGDPLVSTMPDTTQVVSEAPRMPEPDGLRPVTASDMDNFIRGYRKNNRIEEGIFAVAKAQRDQKTKGSILDRAEPVTGYDEASLIAQSNLPRLEASNRKMLEDGQRQSMTAGENTILPTGGVMEALKNVPGNFARSVGSTADAAPISRVLQQQ